MEGICTKLLKEFKNDCPKTIIVFVWKYSDCFNYMTCVVVTGILKNDLFNPFDAVDALKRSEDRTRYSNF